MNFPTDWSSEHKITIDNTKVSDADTADITNYPVYLSEDNFLAAAFSNSQGKEINSNYLLSDSGLMAYYRFESGALTTDTSGNSHTLSDIDTPTLTTGKFGGGVDLGGTDAYSASDHADFKPTTGFTISMWIKTASSATQYLFQSYSQNTNVAGIRLSLVSGVADIVSGDNTGTTETSDWENARGIRDLGDDEWHHIAGVWDGSYLRIYVDGVEEGSTAWTTAPSYAGTNYIRIGCANNSGSNTTFYTGDMDDVSFFDRALAPLEVRSIWTGGADLRFTSDEAGTTVLDHEVVNWDIDGSTAEVHVTMTVDYNDDTDFYVWYNNSSATPHGREMDTLGSMSVLSANQKGYWKFESDATDETANNNDLTGSGSPTHPTGFFNNGVDLELSSSQYYSITDAAQTGLDITGDISILGWIKLEQLPSTAGSVFTIASKDDTTGAAERTYKFEIHSTNNRLRFFYSQGSGNHTASYVENAFTAGDVGKWIHVAVSADVSAKNIELYINGEKKTVTAELTNATSIQDNSYSFYIGASGSGGSPINYFDGMIDDLSVYNTAVSERFVGALYGNRGTWNDNYALVSHDFRYDSSPIPYNNPTMQNGASFISTGALTYGADLDGSDDYIDWGSAIPKFGDADWTVIALCNFDTLSSNYKDIMNHQVDDGANTSESWQLDAMSDGDVRLSLYGDGAIESSATGIIDTAAGWQHVAATFDLSASTGEVWVDGTSAVSGAGYGTMAAGAATYTTIGARYITSVSEVTGTYDGQISEYRIYKGVLTDGFIVTSYNNLLSPSTFATATALVISQACNETITVTDSITRSIGKLLTDAITLVEDLVARNLTQRTTLTETISLVDSIGRSISKAVSETIQLTDSIVKKVNGVVISFWRRIARPTASWTEEAEPTASWTEEGKPTP